MARSCRGRFSFEHLYSLRPAGRSSSAADGWRGAVLLVADVLAPRDGTALVVDFLHRYVGHEAVRGGAVPVVLAGLEEHAVARADYLDRFAAALREADALGDVDGLAVGVGVPRGPRARGEVDAARLQVRGTRRRRDRIDVNRAGEPLARPDHGLDGVPGDLHGVLPKTSLHFQSFSPVPARGCGDSSRLVTGPQSAHRLALASAASRSRSTSRTGGAPKSLLYSRVKCEASP